MGIRITQSIINNSMLQSVNNSYCSLSKLQGEISSGKRISRPSDDPFGVGQSMQYRTKLAEIETFKGNANDAKDQLNAADDALSQASDVFNRLRELVVQASSDTSNGKDRASVAEEIKGLKDQFGDIANATYNGKYIFAKPDSTTTPPTPPYQNGSLDKNKLSDTPQNVELSPGSTIQKNTLGVDVFEDSAGKTVFDEIDSLVSDLTSGKTGTDITAHLKTLDDQLDHFTTIQTTIGAKVNRIDQSIDRLNTNEVNVTRYLSDTEDVDVAKAMTDLSTQENVHKAALSVGARIIQPSLMDYLK